MRKSKTPPQDPFAEREAQNYANPIPSREFILQLLDSSTGPMDYEQIVTHLNLVGDEPLEALRRRLNAMERDGQLVRNRKGGFGKIDKMDLIRGRVQGHRDGYGFVIPAEGGEDLYLSNRQMRKVFDGDEVLVRHANYGFKGRKEGAIVEVVSHNTQQVVGRLTMERGLVMVRPENPRIVQNIVIVPEGVNGAEEGQLVVVDIEEYPNRDSLPKGRVAEVLGDHLAPGMEIDVAIRNHGVPYLWPTEVTALASGLSAEVSEKDKKNRIDLRHLPLVTIDGEDARDFDDAVYCEPKKSGGWRLYVAIADVSHYVNLNDALDSEAIVRGNSVYFPDYVVPMLPEALSNGLCSLNPNVDRLCMVCEMTVSATGKVSGYQFYEAVMHSHARLTYTPVGQLLAERDNKKSGIRKQFHHVVNHLDSLHDLFHVFQGARKLRGAIEFESQETRILFDDERKIKQIVPVTRNDAHRLIEECMLAANVCAAKFLEHFQLPALYRVHEGPKAQKLELLREFLNGLGLGFPSGEKVGPDSYQTVLASVKDRPDANIIQTVMLRSMNQAVYQPDNKGHFGLAYTAYAHFTSPIRRYPDLLVHRAIRSVIRSEIETNKVKRHPKAKKIAKKHIYPYSLADMLTLGEQCSLTERRADDATRDVVSWLKCEYLQGHVGEVFSGVVSAVTSFGLFVELHDIFVEGLVHITSLPQDYYHHEPAHHCLVGERTQRMFALGDLLTVRVVRVNLDERKIDFDIVGDKKTVGKKRTPFIKPGGPKPSKGKKRGGSGKTNSDSPGSRIATKDKKVKSQPKSKPKATAKAVAKVNSKAVAKPKAKAASKVKMDESSKAKTTVKKAAAKNKKPLRG